MAATNCSTDDGFGPFVSDNCRSGFDFTLLFEQSILTLLPAGLFILAGSARLVRLAGREPRTKGNPVRFVKVTAAIAFSALQLAIVVLWSKTSDGRTKLTLPAAAVNLVAGVLITAVSWFEDALSVQPSTLLNIYLLFTLLFDTAQVRTLWLLRKGHDLVGGTATPAALPALLSASVAMKLAMLLLEAHEKRSYLQPRYRNLPPEPTSGIVNRSFLWWLNGLFRRGLRAGKGIMLVHDDLYQLDEELSATHLRDVVQRQWNTRKQPERRFEFVLAIYKGLWWQFLKAVFPRACLIGFTFAQPFLISKALSLITTATDANPMMNERYGLVGATGIVYIGIAVSTLHFKHTTFRFLTMFRGAAVSLIYNRTLVLQDDVYDESAAVTLMSTDVDRINSSLESINEIWAHTIELIIGITLLARQLGWVSVVPLIVVLISSYGSTLVAKAIGSRQKVWVEAVQKRIAITTSMLAEMRSVKMLGLSRLLTIEVQDLRVKETNKMAGYRWCILWLNVAANMNGSLAPPATFVVYSIQAAIRGTPSIDTTTAFTSLSIISLLTTPATHLLADIPRITSILPCFSRIQKFIASPAREDSRRLFQQSSTESLDEWTSDYGTSTHGIELAPLAENRALHSTPAVLVEELSVRPVATADLVLRDATFQVEKGSSTMILGPVGCGKTTLLKALLGEVPYEQGQVTVSTKRMAFCSQTPWLPNTTIRQAICGPTKADDDFDADWYATVLRSCALDHDLSMMVKGDETEVGAGSTELSGGQKQRVALARAIYARAEIVVLDDVLSALDAKTSRIVVDRLFDKERGIFRSLGTAVVLVTHATKCLSYADQILVIDTEGHIKPAEGEIPYESSSDSDGNDESVPAHKQQDKSGAKQTAAEIQKENQKRDLSRATGDLSIYKYLFRTGGVWLPVLFVVVTMLEVATRSMGPVVLNFWAAVDGRQAGLYASIYCILGLLSLFCNGGSIWTSLIKISPKMAQKLHYIVLKTVMRAPAWYLSQTESGSILNRFSQDMTIIEGQLAIALMLTTLCLFQSLADAAMIATGSSYMAATLPALFATIYCLQYVYLRTSRQLRLLDLENRGPLYSHFTETLDGLVVIRAFGWQAENIEKNKKLLDFSQRPYYMLYCIQRWLNLVMDLVVAAEALFVVGLALGIRSSTISPGLLGVSLNYVLTFSISLSMLVVGYTQLETSLGSVARVRTFEAEVLPENKEGENVTPPSAWPEKGDIQFTGVTASHNPEAVALRNISLHIKAGQKIGVCGRTGSGKSSLVGTLLRLLEIDQGSIVIDGIDLATVPRDTIRERFVTIPQDPLILAGSTVRRNVDPDGVHADATIVAALDRVGLWTTVLRDREGGLDADMTASSLSRGQQQLFALSRAVLKGVRTGGGTYGDRAACGKILLLDEATSSVDGDTDDTIQRVLRQDFADYTVIAVAHRIHTVMGSDVAIVMENGHIVEMGAPTELLQNPSGRFSTLARS